MPPHKVKPKPKSRRKPKKKAKPRPKAKVDPEFGIELCRLREKAGLSTLELAKLAGLSQSTIIVTEAGKGERDIRPTNRKKLLDAIEQATMNDTSPKDIDRIARALLHIGRSFDRMPQRNVKRVTLAVERIALAFEQIAEESPERPERR